MNRSLPSMNAAELAFLFGDATTSIFLDPSHASITTFVAESGDEKKKKLRSRLTTAETVKHALDSGATREDLGVFFRAGCLTVFKAEGGFSWESWRGVPGAGNTVGGGGANALRAGGGMQRRPSGVSDGTSDDSDCVVGGAPALHCVGARFRRALRGRGAVSCSEIDAVLGMVVVITTST